MAKASSFGYIPDEFFTALAFLIPYLNRVAQGECGIDIGGVLVLLHLTIYGKPLDRRPTMLRRDLTKILLQRGFSEAGASRLLQGLELNGFVQRVFIPPAVREEHFEPSDRSTTLAVVLTPEGAQKVEEFKTALRHHFGRWLSQESGEDPGLKKWLRGLVPTALPLAQSLIKRIAGGSMNAT